MATKTARETATLVESARWHVAYDLGRTAIVVDHPEHGRLLMVEGYGGERSMRGGAYRAYRWRNGSVWRVPAGFSISETAGQESEHCNVSRMDDFWEGAESRNRLSWPGAMIDRCATAALAKG